jgi:hypothetical protein
MACTPRNPAKKTRGKPFEKGNGGKPKGARRKTTVLAEKLLQGNAKAIVQAVIDAAKGGDIAAARIVLDRIAPARRDNPVCFTLPKIESDADAAKAAILAAVARGSITPGEADQVAGLLETYTKTSEVRDLEARIVALEQRGPAP